jgi:hypothetical protein
VSGYEWLAGLPCLSRHSREGMPSKQHTAAPNQDALPGLPCQGACSSALRLHILPPPAPLPCVQPPLLSWSL